MSALTETTLAGEGYGPGQEPVVVVPCAARPSTRFVHLDGPCRCFAGGPSPEFAPALDIVVHSA